MKITVKINLAKIIENLKKYDGKKVILMVKADAYGHGLKEVAKATESLVEGFGDGSSSSLHERCPLR